MTLHLENIDVKSIDVDVEYEAKKNTDEPILPQMPSPFKIASLIGMDHDNKRSC